MHFSSQTKPLTYYFGLSIFNKKILPKSEEETLVLQDKKFYKNLLTIVLQNEFFIFINIFEIIPPSTVQEWAGNM